MTQRSLLGFDVPQVRSCASNGCVLSVTSSEGHVDIIVTRQLKVFDMDSSLGSKIVRYWFLLFEKWT